MTKFFLSQKTILRGGAEFTHIHEFPRESRRHRESSCSLTEGFTSSFRGIDRDQVLGSFIPYEGDYWVTLKEDTWRDAKEYGKIEGKTSESGGFYGSFTIPEDIEPGIYKLEYNRWDIERETKSITINVAFFERLKFQTALSMP